MSREPAPTPPETNPFAEMVRNPAARTYLLVAAAGLVVAAAVLFLFFNSVVGAVAVVLAGAVGLALRWPVGPPLVVVAVAWCTFTPLGVPLDVPRGNQVPGRQFHLADILLASAALVHLLAAYRFHAVMRAGMPFEAPTEFVKRGAKATVRPAVPVRDSELWFLFARVGAFVLGGQLLWLLVTKLRVDFRKDFPIAFHETVAAEMGYAYLEPGVLPLAISRFVLAVGAFAALGFAVWFAVWYWRLASLNRDEGRASCVDQEWAANRRAYHLPEKWRGWTKQKLAGTLPRKGCGAWFLVVGLPLVMVSLFALLIVCLGMR